MTCLAYGWCRNYAARSTALLRSAGRRQANVVKTLSSVSAVLMTNPDALSGPSTVFLSGDDRDDPDTSSRPSRAC
jgi:hypothetical protein